MLPRRGGGQAAFEVGPIDLEIVEFHSTKRDHWNPLQVERVKLVARFNIDLRQLKVMNPLDLAQLREGDLAQMAAGALIESHFGNHRFDPLG